MGFNAFFIFLGDFLIDRFHFSTVQISVVMIVLGATMGSVSLSLVGPVFARFKQTNILTVTVLIMVVFIGAYAINSASWLAYILIIPIIAAFGITYPTLLSMFSSSVDASRQGWVMGVCVALFTLGSGTASIVGGSAMRFNPALPLYMGIGSCILALLLIAILWHSNRSIADLDPHSAAKE